MLTPMIDCIFLLIIFFMTTSRMSNDVLFEMPLSIADQGKDIQAQSGRVLVNVDADGQVIILKEKVSDATLLSMLRATLKEQGPDQIKCVVRVHKNTALKNVQRVLGVLAEAGVWRIAYAVQERE